VCTLSQKNANISVQGVRILDPRPVLEASNSTRSFERRQGDLITKYSSEKAMKLTDVQKKNF
jgi:hypothetical protein